MNMGKKGKETQCEFHVKKIIIKQKDQLNAYTLNDSLSLMSD